MDGNSSLSMGRIAPAHTQATNRPSVPEQQTEGLKFGRRLSLPDVLPTAGLRTASSEPDLRVGNRRLSERAVESFDVGKGHLTRSASADSVFMASGVDLSPLSLQDNPFMKADGKQLSRSEPDLTALQSPKTKRSFKSMGRSLIMARRMSAENNSFSRHAELGLKKVAGYENQGIPESYLKQSQEVADEQGVIFAYRPVAMVCRTLIEEGAKSKGLDIKAKSSDWGPMAGYIPLDQKFSKIAGIQDEARRNQQIEKYNSLNAKTIDAFDPNQVTQLSISQKRMDELTDMGMMTDAHTVEPLPGFQDAVVFLSAPSGGEKQTFEAHKSADGQWKVFSGTGDARQELQVIPKTADFDLLFSFAQMEQADLGSTDKKQAFDAKLGIYTSRNLELINGLNEKFDRGVGHEMLHHGADTENPATDMAANLPATIFIPKHLVGKMGVFTESPVLIKSKEGLTSLFRTLRDNGVRVESNPLWDQLKDVVKEPFNKKVDFFNRQSQ